MVWFMSLCSILDSVYIPRLACGICSMFLILGYKEPYIHMYIYIDYN